MKKCSEKEDYYEDGRIKEPFDDFDEDTDDSTKKQTYGEYVEEKLNIDNNKKYYYSSNYSRNAS